MSEVFILGIGHTKLGKFPDSSVKDLTKESVHLALDDAGLKLQNIEAAWFSNVRQGQMEGQNSIRGQCALGAMGVHAIPIFNIENACASSSSGLFNAFLAVKSGMFETVMVVGTEKMFYPEQKEKMMTAFFGGTDIHKLKETWDYLAHQDEELGDESDDTGTDRWEKQSYFMDIYAALARQHMRKYGTTQMDIAHAAAKNHWHSTMNPLSQYQIDMSVEEVLADPVIAWPLTRSMCAPISDGSCTVIISTNKNLNPQNAKRAIQIKGMGASSTTYRELDDLEAHCVAIAAQKAYEMAGIQPTDIDVVELHDATSFAELLQIENLGLCSRGEAGAFTRSGATTLGGKVPVNPSGGLVSKGHPIAATGLSQIHEIVTQLRHEAGARQVESARIGVCENGGGFLKIEDAAAIVTVLGRDE